MTDLILTQCFAPNVGGIEGMMTGMALALALAGRDVLVMADGSVHSCDAAFAKQGVKILRTGGWKPLRRWRKARRAQALIKNNPECRVICDSWKSLELLETKPCRVLCLAHGMEYPQSPSAYKVARIRAALVKADLVLANSRFTLENVKPFLPQNKETGLFAPPIDPQRDAAQKEIDSLLSMTGGKPFIAGLGRLEPRKGFDKVIEALATTHSLSDFHFILGGGGADRERLEALTQAQGVQERVHLLGRVDEAMKAALLSSALVFTMPSRREGSSVEGYGIVYHEAGWYGVPSIAGQDGGARDAVTHEQTGFVVDGRDMAAIAHALETLLRNEPLRKQMGEAAAKTSHASVWSQQVQKLIACLDGG